MAGATNRAYKAGELLANSLIEMVHLMYQNNTALSFFHGLMKTLNVEYKRRMLRAKQKELNKRKRSIE